MHRSTPVMAVLLAGLLLLPACSENRKTGLVSQFTGTSSTGPDEFLVLPQKPLEMPVDLALLPQPTPGSANRVDLNPLADAQLALTGRTVANAGLTRGDQALLAATGAQNANANIRATLAREDAQLREDSPGLFFEKIFAPDLEVLTYNDMVLNAVNELARLRALGIITPAAPPAEQP